VTPFLFLPFSSSAFLIYGTTVLLFIQLTCICTCTGGGESRKVTTWTWLVTHFQVE
jgi:hypothetical protein